VEEIALQQVEGLRLRWNEARALAGLRFSDGFAGMVAAPEVGYLRVYAAAMLESFPGIALEPPWSVDYEISDDRLLSPILVSPAGTKSDRVLPLFTVDRSPLAVLSYWIFISELYASPAWQLTRLVVTPEEYDVALAAMLQPQIVRALLPTLLPRVELKYDGTAVLDVTVFTRAGEERMERRRLLLDGEGEFHPHGRDLFAEGRGRVAV
jgi:hypothetical protein